MRYHLTLVRKVIIKILQKTKDGDCVEKGNPPTLLVGMQIDTATMKNITEVSQKTKIRVTIQSSSTTSGYIPSENSNSKRYMHPQCSQQHYLL